MTEEPDKWLVTDSEEPYYGKEMMDRQRGPTVRVLGVGKRKASD